MDRDSNEEGAEAEGEVITVSHVGLSLRIRVNNFFPFFPSPFLLCLKSPLN